MTESEVAVEKKRGLRKKNLSKNIFVWGMLAYPLILFLIFYVGVNASSFIMAFQEYHLNSGPTFAGFANFSKFISDIFGNGQLLNIALSNSLKMYFISLVICMPLYLLFSYLLYKKFFGHKFIRFAIMMPAVISTFVFCLVFKYFVGEPFQQIMKAFGYEDFSNLLKNLETQFGTTLFYDIWVSFTMSMIVYSNAMNAVDDEIIESAKLDGINNMLQEMWYIILPMIFPTISTFLITGFAGILSNGGSIMLFFMYSADPVVYNMGYYYTVKVANATNQLGYPVLAAGGMLMTLLVAPLTILLRKFLEHVSPVRDA